MRKLVLFLMGFVPLILGGAINNLASGVFFDRALPYALIGVAFLVLWFGLGVLSYNFYGSDGEAMIMVHLLGIIILFLAFFQEIIIKRYWDNQIGLITQLYFLPLINLAGKLVFFFHRFYQLYLAAFILMFLAFYLGRSVGKRQV